MLAKDEIPAFRRTEVFDPVEWIEGRSSHGVSPSMMSCS